MDEDALDEIYLGDFDGFVGRRNELAKRLRGEGDAEAAEQARALRKPNRVAWALNRLGARDAKLRDKLLAAGKELRDAQEKVVGGKAKAADLRAVADRERQAVQSATDALASDPEAQLSTAALERARQTLHAVALDEDVRRDFERHRLTTDHEAAALGGLSPGGGGARPKADDGRAAKRRRDELRSAEAEAGKLERRLREAERNAEAAQSGAEKAQKALARATKDLEEAQEKAAAARQRADDLRQA